MGITGLHKGLGFCTRKSNVREFSGQVLAIDTSSWLHRSVYSISERYVESMEDGRLDERCVQVSAKYITSRCQELVNNFRVAKVILVMDGKRCPLKAGTNQERERRRQQNLDEARRYKNERRFDKAEEKYKSCIKIRDDLTDAVLQTVERHFARDRRVELVWSPYEADAQLVCLCIGRQADAVVTEDSDVLVYSAASHVSFPVLFKLDRNSGSCDIINMDWLLTPVVEENPSNKKQSSSTLETLLKNLAARQCRRPGFGVRLFVQACVLAGCDYAPSRLNGVGLVNAFKHVRDNAYRNHANRFEKILASLPRKLRAEINVEEYEALLAKSEAVFYYHLVCHTDGTVRPINKLRFSDKENGEIEHFQDHFPFLERFDEEISFLGDKEVPPPISEIIVRHEEALPSKSPTPKHNTAIVTKKRPLAISNPYRKSKVAKAEDRRPFDVLNPNTEKKSMQPTRANPFSKFSRQPAGKEPSNKPHNEPRNGESGMKKYLLNKQDVRFVKRKFQSTGMTNRKSAPVGPVKASNAKRDIFPLSTQYQSVFAASQKRQAGIQSDPTGHVPPHITTGIDAKMSGQDDGQNNSVLDEASFNNYGSCHMDPLRSSSVLAPGSGEFSDPERGTHDPVFHSPGGILERKIKSSGQGVLRPVVDLTDSNSGLAHSYSDDPRGSGTSVPANMNTGGYLHTTLCDNPPPSDVLYAEQVGGTEEVSPFKDAENQQDEFEAHGGLSIPGRSDLRELIPPSVQEPAQTSATPTESKYFQMHSRRRVTLDPSDRLPSEEGSFTGLTITTTGGSAREGPAPFLYGETGSDTSPAIKRAACDYEEQIDSPPAAIDDGIFYSHYCTNPFQSNTTTSRSGGRGIPFTSRGISKGRKKGPLEHAFQRQQQLASSQESSGSPPSCVQGSRLVKRNKQGGLNRFKSKAADFFKPVQQKEIQYSQLEVTVLESDEDF